MSSEDGAFSVSSVPKSPVRPSHWQTLTWKFTGNQILRKLLPGFLPEELKRLSMGGFGKLR